MDSIKALVFNTSEELATYRPFEEYPETLLTFASVCCMVFMMIGVPGNLITIIALARYRKAHNATAIFIINLSCSDLLYCCFNLPFAASTFWLGSWTFGLVMCRLFPLMRFALSCVGLLSIMAITINRYVMIAYPRFYQMLYKPRNISCMVIFVWAFSFGAVLPSWFEIWGKFGMDPSTGLCSLIPDQNNNSPKTLYFITAFLIPCITIIGCYARIYQAVRKTMKRSTSRIRRRSQRDGTTETYISTTEQSTSSNKEIEHQETDRTKSILSCFRISVINADSVQREEIKDTKDDIITERRKLSLRTKIFKEHQIGVVARPTRKDKKLLTMITAVIVSFLICHLPLTVLMVVHMIRPHPVPFILSSILRYLTSCINPIIYVVMSNEFRKAYKNVISFRTCGHSCNLRNCYNSNT